MAEAAYAAGSALCSLFQCISAGPKEPKVPRKRQAQKFKNRGRNERGPKRFFVPYFSAGPQRVQGPPEAKLQKKEP
jgi:hypothetical protein